MISSYEQAIENILNILNIISAQIPNEHINDTPIKAYLVGGVATYLHTSARTSDDIDIIFTHRINLPKNLFIPYRVSNEQEIRKLVYDDTYNSTLGLLHEDYDLRAIHHRTIGDKFEVFVLSVEDLIITKLSRFSDKDEEDIKSLISNCQVDKNLLDELLNDALAVSVAINTRDVQYHYNYIKDLLHN